MAEIGDGGGMTGHCLFYLEEEGGSEGFLLGRRAVEGGEIRLGGLDGIAG